MINEIVSTIRLNLNYTSSLTNVLLVAAVNASHHGYFDYGLNRETVGYDVWSYDMMYVPVRIVMKMSRDQCLPLKVASVSLIRNREYILDCSRC